MKVANVLFPSDYFDKNSPDAALKSEYDAAVADGRLDVRAFDLELFEERGVIALSQPFCDEALPLVYRGWMMKPGQYEAFHSALRGSGLRPIVEPVAYAEFHMFPLAYERHEVLRENSPLLVAFQGRSVDAAVVSDSFGRFMVKDYVKSVKGTSFPRFFETPVTQDEMDVIVERFVALRGGLFTEGVVCKEYVDLAACGDATNEWRAFFLGGRLLSLCRNSNQPAGSAAPPESLLASCANLGSPYYTVDFAELADGGWIVVETGDGQVSGLAAAQDAVTYYRVLADAFEGGMNHG